MTRDNFISSFRDNQHENSLQVPGTIILLPHTGLLDRFHVCCLCKKGNERQKLSFSRKQQEIGIYTAREQGGRQLESAQISSE